VVEETHAAGGLFVADEVQAGHGRTGVMWCFENYDITPDVVTLGKPMGNGYPVAAVITRRQIADELAKQTKVFSTFGGNPVAAVAALAVLDVIEDDRLAENAARVGARLGDDIRGRGLLVGVELETPEHAKRAVNQLRAAGILIGRTGLHDNVLKIRPPLVFADEHAEEVARALTPR
jgi:4-aminobutyrate aminotransferase-like enzyme